MIDIVTVVFRDELPILKLQAESIGRYCKNIGVRNIYVVLNDSDELLSQIDPAWYGDMAPHLLIIPRTAFSTWYVDNGWVSQQVLKILAASMSYNTWSMVLDAKTIFVRDVKLEEILDEQGRVRVGTMPIQPVFEPSRQLVNQVFDIDLPEQLGPGGVPYFFHNDTVRYMIAETTFKTDASFPQWFQQQGMLTEFILYSGYVYSKPEMWDMLYSRDRALGIVNICHSEVASFDRKLKEMSWPNTLTVSIHRGAWTQLTRPQQDLYRDYLIKRDISGAFFI
jgi:hypothetical protein